MAPTSPVGKQFSTDYQCGRCWRVDYGGLVMVTTASGGGFPARPLAMEHTTTANSEVVSMTSTQITSGCSQKKIQMTNGYALDRKTRNMSRDMSFQIYTNIGPILDHITNIGPI